MDIANRIFNLFSGELFSAELQKQDFLKKDKTNAFCCKHRELCGVDVNRHAIWSPALGDEDTKAMVIGEAPSTTEGPGGHLGGRFDDWEANSKSPITSLRDWIKSNYGCTPYFTDIVKCGVGNQNKVEKKVLTERAERCFETFLLREIEIVRPQFLFFCGATLGAFLERRRQAIIGIDESIKIIHLTHFSRQANLPLSVEDKMNIIWRLEAGLMSHEEFAEKRLTELSHFRGYAP